VADPLARLAVNNDLCAWGGEKAGDPVNPSSREAQVAKQVTEKCPVTVLNFLTISTLSRMQGIRQACRSLAEDWTTLKLTWITRPWIKAL
jgi:hypothetical protein